MPSVQIERNGGGTCNDYDTSEKKAVHLQRLSSFTLRYKAVSASDFKVLNPQELTMNHLSCATRAEKMRQGNMVRNQNSVYIVLTCLHSAPDPCTLTLMLK